MSLKTKTTTVTESFDAEGNLVERVTETFEDYSEEATAPAPYVAPVTTPWPVIGPTWAGQITKYDPNKMIVTNNVEDASAPTDRLATGGCCKATPDLAERLQQESHKPIVVNVSTGSIDNTELAKLVSRDIQSTLF